MAPAAAVTLVATLDRLQLLEAAQLDEVRRDLQPRFRDPRALGQELLRRGWLTSYQANALLQGRELLLGPYLLLDKLGEGATGVVFKARHQAMRRIVAVKVIRKELVTDAEVVARFYREIEVVSRLSHPNVVHAYDAGPIGTTHFLAMEYVEGIDLTRLVEKQGPLSVARGCECIRQAALGLHHAHEQGLVHRDIKPSNLMLTSEEVVKVLDLGLARFQHAPDGRGLAPLTQDGKGMMGTPDYMAPEQALDLRCADVRADVYSLGCTLFFLLTGKPPFIGNTLAEKLMKHQAAEPPALDQARPEVPGALATAVRRMLAKQPEERQQSMTEVAAALAGKIPASAAIRQQPPSAGSTVADRAAIPTSVAPDLRRPARRGQGLRWIAAAGVLLAFGGVGTFLLLQRPGSKPVAGTGRTGPLVGVLLPGATHIDKPPRLAIEPEPLPRMQPGDPLSPLALVPAPATLAGVRSWTLESRGHRGSVRTVAYSPDGRYLASAGVDNTIRLWEPETGRLVRMLVGHNSSIGLNLLAWSPDGRYLASGSHGEQTIRLWDVETGRLLRTTAATATTSMLTWSPDGRTLAWNSGVFPQPLRLYDAVAGQALRMVDNLNGGITVLSWSPDGKVLALGGTDKMVRRLNVASGKFQLPPLEHTDTIRGVAWSADGKLLASYCQNTSMRIIDLDSGRDLHKLSGPRYSDGPPSGMLWSPDGKLLACCGAHELRVWDAAAFEKPPRLQHQVTWPIAWSADSKWLAHVNGETGNVIDARTGRERFKLDPPSRGRTHVQMLAWSPDSRSVAIPGYMFGRMAVWNLADGSCLTLGERNSAHYGAAWSPDGKELATAESGGHVRISNLAQAKVVRKLEGLKGNVQSVAWSPDGKRIAAGADKTVRIWDAEQGTLLHDLTGHNAAVTVLAWSADSKLLASGGHNEAVVRVWDAIAGRSAQALANSDTLALAWSADGKTLVCGGGNGNQRGMRLWEAQTGKAGPFFRTVMPVRAVSWQSGGDTVAAGLDDNTLLFWRHQTGQNRIMTHVGCGPISPNGRLLVGGWPGHGLGHNDLRIWDLDTGRPRGTLLLGADDQWLTVGTDGYYRSAPNFKIGDLHAVVQTDQGQETLKPTEFSQKYGWTNDPSKLKPLDAR